MEIDTEALYGLLATDSSEGLVSIITSLLKAEIKSKEDWEALVKVLHVACQDTYQKHWLKTQHVMLSLFGVPELLGVDCSIFNELRSLDVPTTMKQASDSLFSVLSEMVRRQLNNGGSTLFFDVNHLSSTRSAILVSDLIKARFRESVHVLNEIDEMIPSLTKEWVDVSRLWKTGNGFRLLKARNPGIHMHIKEYQEVRDLLAGELDVNPKDLKEISNRLRLEGKSNYLQLSKTLDAFVMGLIASRGIRGTFDPYFMSWIDHEGLDEF